MSLHPLSPPKPMLAVSGQPFDSPDWIFEPKIDGTRSIALVSSGTAHLYNRRGFEITYRYPELEKALAGSCCSCILDGEIAVFADGKPNFHSLAQRDHQMEKMRIDYLSRLFPPAMWSLTYSMLGAKAFWTWPCAREIRSSSRSSRRVTM